MLGSDLVVPALGLVLHGRPDPTSSEAGAGCNTAHGLRPSVLGITQSMAPESVYGVRLGMPGTGPCAGSDRPNMLNVTHQPNLACVWRGVFT